MKVVLCRRRAGVGGHVLALPPGVDVGGVRLLAEVTRVGLVSTFSFLKAPSVAAVRTVENKRNTMKS